MNEKLNMKSDKYGDQPQMFGCQRATKSHCISAIGVILLVLLYTAMGSIIFVSLEGDHSEYTNIGETAVAASKPYPRNDLENSDIRSRTVDRLWSITEDLNILYKENWTRLAAQEVLHFQETLLNAVKQSQLQQPSTTPLTQPNKWTYASAFLYSLTLITTIGYGGISPSTQWGRVVAVVYALFGIPIVLLYLSAIGEGLSSGIRCVFRKIRLRSKTTNKATPSDMNFSHTTKMNKLPQLYYPGGISHPYQLAKSPSVPISICILILILYMSLGTLLFHKIQEWSVLESFYFCFTALGTIGFGELAPNGQYSQFIASFYILVGMAVVAMCFSLIQTEIILWLRRMGVQDQVLPPNEEISLVSISPKS